MSGPYFALPFATSGDKSDVPVALQTDGSISYTLGWGPNYEKADTEPGYLPVSREFTNGLNWAITAALKDLQDWGAPAYYPTAAPYAINSIVRHNDIVWRSTVSNNNSVPGANSDWVNSAAPSQMLDTLRIDVPSATNVNLTSLAPNTRHINITGAVNIDSFTISAGMCYFVRFANTGGVIANNANIVTNTGLPITISSGDTCIIRATANNVVEVLCPRILANAAVGTLGQTRQNVMSSRAPGTVYTNTTGRTIEINVGVLDGGGTSTWSMTVGGVFYDFGNPQSGVIGFVTTILPGETYSLNVGGNSLKFWTEIR